MASQILSAMKLIWKIGAHELQATFNCLKLQFLPFAGTYWVTLVSLNKIGLFAIILDNYLELKCYF